MIAFTAVYHSYYFIYYIYLLAVIENKKIFEKYSIYCVHT
jgi:hypothetical protein